MSSKWGLKCILSGVVLFLALLSSYAQPRSLGTSISYTGIAAEYEHRLPKDNSFLNVSLKAQMSEYNADRASYPGISASLTWTSILKQWQSSEGNTISFFAGPGATIGYEKDHKTAEGVFLGIKGRAGIECTFSRKIIISANIAPVIGSHIVYDNGLMSMKYYKNGLLYALVPEVSIKYAF